MAYDRPRDSCHTYFTKQVLIYFGCVAVRVFSHLVPFMPPARAFTAGATSAGKGGTSHPYPRHDPRLELLLSLTSISNFSAASFLHTDLALRLVHCAVFTISDS